MTKSISVDALVVGAGPAGLMFARKFSSKGYRVLVVEKENRLSEKACGEGISARVLMTAEIPIKEKERFVSREIKRAYVYSPSGLRITLNGSEEETLGYIINKKEFLEVMAEYATMEGADIMMMEPAKDFERIDDGFNVKTKNCWIKTRLLVGADGYLSTVARKLGFERPRERKIIPSIQYVMVNVELDDWEALEFYVGKSVAPYGYAWIFPKDGKKANVGIGVQQGAPLYYLNKFIKDHPEKFGNATKVEFRGAAVTIGGMLKKIVADNVMLIGEAAGQVIPLTGGGIHSSIAGGSIAADIAIEAFEENDLSAVKLKKYVEEYNRHWGKRIRDSKKALEVIDKLSDEELDKLAEILDPKDVLDLANGLNITRVAAKLMKYPVFSIKIASKLLS
ncbi:MAG: NAD(P)/FAD-dependent oxidoreductase [Thermoproteales archaeon]|nr:NAD(P)/FAD-dependent oxidoreductase [Thermoproteales archaeon]